MTPAEWLTVTSDRAPAVIDGRTCRTRAAFFEETARALDFPGYFGRNWDALTDCLRDAGAVTLIVAHADELLSQEPPTSLATLLAILRTAADDGLTLTLCAEPDQEASLRQRVKFALDHPAR